MRGITWIINVFRSGELSGPCFIGRQISQADVSIKLESFEKYYENEKDIELKVLATNLY